MIEYYLADNSQEKRQEYQHDESLPSTGYELLNTQADLISIVASLLSGESALDVVSRENKETATHNCGTFGNYLYDLIYDTVCKFSLTVVRQISFIGLKTIISCVFDL